MKRSGWFARAVVNSDAQHLPLSRLTSCAVIGSVAGSVGSVPRPFTWTTAFRLGVPVLILIFSRPWFANVRSRYWKPRLTAFQRASPCEDLAAEERAARVVDAHGQIRLAGRIAELGRIDRAALPLPAPLAVAAS